MDPTEGQELASGDEDAAPHLPAPEAVPRANAATMADVLRLAISDAVIRLAEHDPPARLGAPRGIHQVRVAFRRLRSDLGTLDGAVDSSWRNEVDSVLRSVGSALAPTRDLDVLIETVRVDIPDDDGGRAGLLEHLARLRAIRTLEASAALTSPDHVRTLDTLTAAVVNPPLGPAAGSPAASSLPAAVMRRWRRLERRAARLDARDPADDFHRARVAAKAARYASELAARALPSGPSRGAALLADRIADLQTHLGVMQDSVVAESILRQAARDASDSPEIAGAVERQLDRFRLRSEDARHAFLAEWRRTRRRKWRRWAS